MFVKAIEVASGFTRPIHSIVRNYKSEIVQPGASTLFFVNSEGWALTCKHVAALLVEADRLGARREQFAKELEARVGEKKKNRLLQELEQKYEFKRGRPFEVYNNFVNCVEGDLAITGVVHPKLDLALLKFGGKVVGNKFPTFAADGNALKAGMVLCRLGFPFVEFTNYKYDPTTDRTTWTDEGRKDSPWFPLEGMETRQLVGEDGVFGFEMSTPGLRGQSGGPAFDTEGKVWGLQFATNHLDLDFDVNMEVMRQGQKKPVRVSSVLHVGLCIHVNVIKEFMRSHKVQFNEA